MALGAVIMARGASVTVALPEVAGRLKFAASGDTIFVADGAYSDLEMKWKAPGGAVVVKALHPGQVTVTGKSSLRFCGDSLTVSSIDFIGAHPAKGSVVEFRLGNDVANNCRVTDCRIDGCNPARRDIVSSYIVLHGRHNRVDHCSLTGKLNLGVTLLVNLNDARSLDNGHRVDHNYFGHRPVYGSNGAETMRIGTSQQSYETSATVVEENYFSRCNGEVEIISVKSSDNIIRNNVFEGCEGVVALRHGRRNTVAGNIFNGAGYRNTGGVRVVDSGHLVQGNVFYNLKGHRFFSALALMNSVPNSLPNRYVRVSDVVVKENLFADCSNIEFGTGRDMERTEAPADCLFASNIIMTSLTDPFTMIDSDAGVEFADNKIEPLDNKIGKLIQEKCDMARKACMSRFVVQENVDCKVDTIVLSGELIYRSEPYLINKPTVITGKGTTLRWNGKAGGNFITIADGGSLKVSGVTFDGALQQGCAVVRNGIATASDMITPYDLEVEDCEFINMPESGCCGIRGLKGTFAENVTISGCRFADLSGNGISFADETDDKGRYSADDITITDCSFEHTLGIPVNIYRGGSDESTAGPYIRIDDCVFTDCCNRERGSVLRLIGPQLLRVERCVFNGSGRGGATVRLDETTWEDVEVSDCVFINSGRVISNREVVKGRE